MKSKPRFFVITLMLCLCLCTTRSFAADEVAANTPATARAQQITARLDEIKHMDIQSLTTEQRRELRHEVKAMRSEARGMRGGIFIAIGGIIAILLILILLL